MLQLFGSVCKDLSSLFVKQPKDLGMLRRNLQTMVVRLENERSTWISHWQDLADHISPRRPQAELDALNLAAAVQDGERIWVPEKIAKPTDSLQNPTYPQPLAPIPLDSPTDLVNLNTATQSELESLPAIGPVTAAAIIAYRQQHGPFTRLEDLVNVSGIGPATYEKIKDLITLGGTP